MSETRLQIGRAMSAMMAPLARRLRGMITRVTIGSVDDSGRLQRVRLSGLAAELATAERLQHYGLSAVPPSGSTAVMLAPGAGRSNGVVIGADPMTRPTGLADGEVWLYAVHGQTIRLLTSGDIELHPAEGGVVRVVGNGEIAGNLHVGGNISTDGTITAQGQIHSNTGVSGP